MAAAPMEKTSVPGIYRRGNRYVVVYRAKGKQHKQYARTFAEARTLKSQIQADISRGEHRQGGRQTFGEYARDWIDTYQGRTSRGFRESTRVGYRRVLEERAIGYFDKRCKRMVDIEPRNVRQFIAWLFDEKAQEKALTLSTVRNHVAAVRACLATAYEDGEIRSNPAAGVRISKPGGTSDDEQKRRAMTRTELRAFLDHVDPDWRLLFELLAHSGMRISEARELRWGDIDLAGARLRIRRQVYRGEVGEPKSRLGKRELPLAPGMVAQLREREGWPDALVFPASDGKHFAEYTVRRYTLDPAAAAAGVPWATFHSFRHTCASLLFGAGRNVKVVQEWLGHSDPGFTLRTYVHLLDEGLGDAGFLDQATAQGVTVA
jgi:integrase